MGGESEDDEDGQGSGPTSEVTVYQQSKEAEESGNEYSYTALSWLYTVEAPNKGHFEANVLSLVERLSLSRRYLKY